MNVKTRDFTTAIIAGCLFYRKFKYEKKNVFVLPLMYVDDNFIMSRVKVSLNVFEARMHDKFKLLTERDREKNALYVSLKICKSSLSGYEYQVMLAAGWCSAEKNTEEPCELNLYRSATGSFVYCLKWFIEPCELNLYRSATGSFICLCQCTKIDIVYVVSALAAHMSNVSRDHHVALKHLLHYLHGTRDRGTVYHAF